MISGSGGLIGVMLGLAVPPIVGRMSGMPVVINSWSPLLAFLIALLRASSSASTPPAGPPGSTRSRRAD